MISLEERVTAGNRRIMKPEFHFDPGSAGIEDLPPIRCHLQRPSVLEEVRRRRLALEDRSDANNLAPPGPASRLDLTNPLGPAGGDIETEAKIRQGDLAAMRGRR